MRSQYGVPKKLQSLLLEGLDRSSLFISVKNETYILRNIMTSPTPLHANELIDCARANAEKDIEVVAERCGYGQDITKFEQELKKAYHSIGVEIEGFEEMRQRKRESEQQKGIEVAPETPSQL